jgi:hypothetical protein
MKSPAQASGDATLAVQRSWTLTIAVVGHCRPDVHTCCRSLACCCCKGCRHGCDAPHERGWVWPVHRLVCVSLHPHDALDVLDEALLGPNDRARPADADVANDLLQGDREVCGSNSSYEEGSCWVVGSSSFVSCGPLATNTSGGFVATLMLTCMEAFASDLLLAGLNPRHVQQSQLHAGTYIAQHLPCTHLSSELVVLHDV